MDECISMLKTTLIEIERVLSTKTVVGEPMVIEANTVVPLVSIGFAFGSGVGGTSNTGEKKAPGGTGGGAGGFGAIKPVAVIVVSKEGVNIVPIVRGAVTILERVGEMVGKAIEKRGEKKKEE